MNRERLMVLAEFLEELPDERFDFGTWVGGYWRGAQDLSCGTTACAMGWGTVLFGKECGVAFRRNVDGAGYPVPTRTALDPEDVDIDETSLAAAKMFGVDYDEFDFLFVPESPSNELTADATAREVAAHIRKFVAHGGIYA